MGETEILIFIILTSLIVAVFIIGLLLFAFQYKRKQKDQINENKLLHEQHQQEILTTQLQSQQQTMRHIGTEIHDNVGQKLTLASLYSKQMNIHTVDLEQKINTISNIIDESLTELRQLSKTLTNPELANAGLLVLLHAEAKRINASGLCRIAVNTNDVELLLSQGQKNIVFRLLQEFIQNSLKHSGCRKIEINLIRENNNLSIVATDDGKGFDLKTATGGIGLQNMKRRAEQLIAAFQIKSEAEKGTTLQVQFQLTKDEI